MCSLQPPGAPLFGYPPQHGDPRTLRRMRRPANIEWVHTTLGKMRTAMPDLALRTTFIVGYPGETEEEFQTLIDFLKTSGLTGWARSPSHLNLTPPANHSAIQFLKKSNSAGSTD